MIRSLVQAATSFLLAAREERLALAELHRAQAVWRPAPIDTSPVIEIPLTPLAPSKSFACPDRWAECVFANMQDTDTDPVDHAKVVKAFSCETHLVEAGVPCPEDLPKQAEKPVLEDLAPIEPLQPSIEPLAAE